MSAIVRVEFLSDPSRRSVDVEYSRVPSAGEFVTVPKDKNPDACYQVRCVYHEPAGSKVAGVIRVVRA